MEAVPSSATLTSGVTVAPEMATVTACGSVTDTSSPLASAALSLTVRTALVLPAVNVAVPSVSVPFSSNTASCSR